MLGDPSKAKNKLGWKPKVKFGELVAEMMRADVKSVDATHSSIATATLPIAVVSNA